MRENSIIKYSLKIVLQSMLIMTGIIAVFLIIGKVAVVNPSEATFGGIEIFLFWVVTFSNRELFSEGIKITTIVNVSKKLYLRQVLIVIAISVAVITIIAMTLNEFMGFTLLDFLYYPNKDINLGPGINFNNVVIEKLPFIVNMIWIILLNIFGVISGILMGLFKMLKKPTIKSIVVFIPFFILYGGTMASGGVFLRYLSPLVRMALNNYFITMVLILIILGVLCNIIRKNLNSIEI